MHGWSNFPLLPANTVVGAIFGAFRGGEGSQELVIATCDCLRLYEVGDFGTKLRSTCMATGRIEAVHLLSPPDAYRIFGDRLAVLVSKFSQGKQSWCLEIYGGGASTELKKWESTELPSSEVAALVQPDAPLISGAKAYATGSKFLAPEACHQESGVCWEHLIGISAYQNAVHMVLVHFEFMCSSKRLSAIRVVPKYPFVLGPNGDGPQRVVLSLCMLPPLSDKNAPTFAVLIALEGGVKEVELYMLPRPARFFTDPTPSLPLFKALSSLLHHTTTLLAPAPISNKGNSGIVLVSQQAISSYIIIEEGKRAVVMETEINIDLPDLPTCCCLLSEESLVIGDASGGLALVDLKSDSGVGRAAAASRRIDSSLAPCMPFCLTASSQVHHGKVMLFVGSLGGPSQLLELDCQWQQARQVELPTLFADGVAPIHDAVRYLDPAGSDEGILLMCCGLAPSGSICLGRLAAQLSPTLTGGPKLELQPRLLAVKAAGSAEHDSYLALSFDSAGYTTLLDIRGTSIVEVQHPGLALDCSTLCLARIASSNHLLHITPKGVWIVPDVLLAETASQLALGDSFSWQSSNTLSMAACCGSCAVIVSGHQAGILILQQPINDGPSHWHQFPEQISAVALFEMPKQQPEVTSATWLAVGQWRVNKVVLCRVTGVGEEHRITVDILQGQPRSIAVGHFDGESFLFVGTSEGVLVYIHIREVDGALVTGESWQVRVGLGGVDLEFVPAYNGKASHIFAAAEHAVIIQHRERSHIFDLSDHLSVARVHEADNLLSCCSVNTPEMPAACAYISPSGRLTFGCVSHEVKLRVKRKGTGGTPLKLVVDNATGCAVVIVDDMCGSSSLKLYQATSLRQLASLQMTGHSATALSIVSLPFKGTSDVVKECIVVASFVETEAADQLVRAQSLLHVIEIVQCPSQGSTSGSYDLVLHGSIEIGSPCFSLVGVEDTSGRRKASRAGGSEGDSASKDDNEDQQTCVPPGSQLVAAGCEDGVHLYRIAVRDILEQGQEAVRQAATAIMTASSSDPAVPGARDNIEGSPRKPDWRWHDCVEHHLICKEEAGGESCVVGVSSVGNSVLAVELYGSLTHFLSQPEQQSKWEPALRRTSSFTAPAGCFSAVAALNSEEFLGGLFPRGVVSFRRAAQQEALLAAARLEMLQTAHEGSQPIASLQPELYGMTLQRCYDLEQTITKFCIGHLGLRVQAASCSAQASASSGASPVTAAQDKAVLSFQQAVLYTTKEGSIGFLLCWDLLELQKTQLALYEEDPYLRGGEVQDAWEGECFVSQILQSCESSRSLERGRHQFAHSKTPLGERRALESQEEFLQAVLRCSRRS